jgi:hypothetical protein
MPWVLLREAAVASGYSCSSPWGNGEAGRAVAIGLPLSCQRALSCFRLTPLFIIGSNASRPWFVGLIREPGIGEVHPAR